MDKIKALEGEIINLKQLLSKNKENVLKEFLYDLETSVNDILEKDKENTRFNFEPIDFKETIINLQKYIAQFRKDNNI